MKRIILCTAILLLTAVLLCACGDAPTVDNCFTVSFTAQRDEDDVNYAGTLQKTDDGICITMTAPYTVQGMRFTYESGAAQIARGGLSANADSDYLPDNSLPATLNRDMSFLPQASYRGVADGRDRYRIATPNGEAELLAENGIPTALTDDTAGWKVEFEN